jgi:fermentation-respiration switch protein FrsA (DUF1100 family)
MSRVSLGAAILLLAAGTMTLAPASAVEANQDPARESDTAQDRSQTANADGPARMVEGCLSSIDDAFILTDADGRTYQLTGDTAQLTARAGTHVRLWGNHDSVTDAESITAGQPLRSFHVVRAKSMSAGCGTPKA